MTRFRTTDETYLSADHATRYTAVAEVEPGHTVTREWTWTNHFGPVPGTHFVRYSCTCGADFVTYERPHGRHVEAIEHFGSDAEREAHEAAEAEHLAAIMRTLGEAGE